MIRNSLRAIKILAWLLTILGILVLVIFPLITSRLAAMGKMPMGVSSLVYIELAQTFVMRAFGVVWFFFLGSCFASFLNVVAWRVPRGRGINGSSHCPFCNAKLAFRDNLPIIGWLRNGGRCATCRHSIPIRYLIVEIVLGFVFLLVVMFELFAGGWNLPLHSTSSIRGFENLILDPPADLIQLTVYHLILICSLFTFVLIRSDRFQIPIAVYATALAFGLGLPMIWPDMLLVSWHITTSNPVELSRFSLDQWGTLLTGWLAGTMFGLLIQTIFRTRGESKAPPSTQPANPVWSINEYFAGFSLIGVFLGWQSVMSVSLIFLIFSLFGSRFSATIRIFMATLVHLLLWRWLTIDAIAAFTNFTLKSFSN